MIRVERDGGVVSVVLDRAARRNAMTPEMFAEIRAALDHAGDARAILLAGDGSVFCGGFDLNLCVERPGTLAVLLRELASLIERLRSQPAPVVIAAHGAAIAGACALLTAADTVVVDDRAKIGYPVLPLGVSPAVSAASLRPAIGDGAARARLLDPSLVSGREALRLGLAHECLADAPAVRPRALEVARTLASKPVGAMAATRRWLRQIDDLAGPPGAAESSLAASLSIVGSDEERERLTKAVAR